MKKRVKLYFHRSKEANYDIAKKIGITPDSDAERQFVYTGCEEAIYYDVDINTGEAVRVHAQDGRIADVVE